VEEVLQCGQNGMMRFVVIGKQEYALFYFGQFFLEIKDMGFLDVIDNYFDGKGIEIPCVEQFVFKHPKEGSYKFYMFTRHGRL
jgi:hypothetical protein